MLSFGQDSGVTCFLGNHMEFWSYQYPDFDITKQRCHVSLSRWKDYPNIMAAYGQLASRLEQSSLNVLWCVCKPEPENWKGDIEWHLEVPDWKWIIDAFVWGRIIGRKTVPQTLRDRWYGEGLEKGVSGSSYSAKKTEEYLARRAPQGGWWSELFIDDLNAEGANVLVEPPIPEKWVLGRRRV